MKRLLLFVLPIALLSLTGCGCGPFGFLHRGDRCQQPCTHFDAGYATTSVCHPGVLGGGIVADGAYDGIPTVIEGPRPGPAEAVAPGR